MRLEVQKAVPVRTPRLAQALGVPQEPGSPFAPSLSSEPPFVLLSAYLPRQALQAACRGLRPKGRRPLTNPRTAGGGPEEPGAGRAAVAAEEQRAGEDKPFPTTAAYCSRLRPRPRQPRSPSRRPPLAHRAGPSSSSSQLRVPAAVATAAAAAAAAEATVDSDSVPGRRATAAAATASTASGLPPAAAEAAPAAGAILLLGLLFLLLVLRRPVARCPRPLPLPQAPARPGDWGGDEGEDPPSGGGAGGGEGRAREQSSESPATNARRETGDALRRDRKSHTP
nr:translation initiation factor IF-2-like [Gorilla gorilla gorilla]